MKRNLLMVLAGVILAIPYQVLVAQPQARDSQAEKYLANSFDGRLLYQNYCAVCHGDNARGSGPMAKALKTPPPDLTQIAVRNTGIFPARKVEQIITGEGPFIAHGTREMPLWGPIFSQIVWDQDLGRVRVANLVKYLASIQTPPRAGYASER